MTELRGALIGCGFFAVNQMHAWGDVTGAGIVAICDRDPERLKVVGDQFGISRRYSDAAQMFANGGFDFVDIATTVSSHRALVELAASYKVPAICQKPFAKTLNDAKAMVAACAKAGVPLMVHENFRWQTPIQAVRSVLASGVIGAPFWADYRSARVTTSSPASHIWLTASASSSRISASTHWTSRVSCSATSRR